ncbi:hypothetical protein NPA31_011790 [Aurantimonas sp. MSK8Z-1]|uniref:hypothetical protein n=1 Tax=Mangrovibrevibacter kandeliae TaxID=2968473 RepID=UPI0021194736|nr:hypothetical protein [Aurantimonas sp. MSK8Z-1]MCW4115645.1 hypothetical protein [Aurantimonas sp. MSK8Z-1]
MPRNAQTRAGDGRVRRHTTIRLLPEIRDELKRVARREGRTEANLIERLLIQGLRNRRRVTPSAAEKESVFE